MNNSATICNLKTHCADHRAVMLKHRTNDECPHAQPTGQAWHRRYRTGLEMTESMAKFHGIHNLSTEIHEINNLISHEIVWIFLCEADRFQI